MKAKLYWTYALRSMARGGAQTLLAVFCIAVGVLTIVALQLTGTMIRSALTSDIATLNGGDIAVHSDNDDMPLAQLSYFQSLERRGVITSYSGVVETGADQDGLRYVIDAVQPASYPLTGQPHLLAPVNGNLHALLRGDNVVLTDALSAALGAHVGQQITLGITDDGRSERVRVAGVLANGGLLSQPTMLIDMASYAARPSLSGVPIALQWVYVNVPGHSPAVANHVAGAIRQQITGVSTTTVAQASRNQHSLVSRIQYFLEVIGLLALLTGGVGIANTMQVLLRRRQLELAMLKTIGYRQGDLIRMFGLEAALVGLLGGVIGATAGIGVMFGIKVLAEQALFLTLRPSYDPLIIGGGVIVGFCTTLIFGLLPIMKTSRIRPMDMIREPVSSGSPRARLSSLRVGLLVAALFFVLTVTIVRSAPVAAGAVLGAGVLLLILGLVFSMVTGLLARFPVPDRFRVVYTVLAALAVLIATGITAAAPGFGVLLLIAALCAIVIVCLPPRWKASIRLALRNAGREKARSASTLIGLFIGVFAVGTALVLGQDASGLVLSVLASHNRYNALVLVPAPEKPALDRGLAATPGIRRELVNQTAAVDVTRVNGEAAAAYIQRQTGETGRTGGQAAGNSRGSLEVGVAGYPLRTGARPDVIIVRGQHDNRTGRNLGVQDANTGNVLLPSAESTAPYNLALGDRLTIQGLGGRTSQVLTIVGFYTSTGFTLAPILSDDSVISGLKAGPPDYAYSLYLDPRAATALTRHIGVEVPGAQIQLLSTTADAVQGVVSSIANVLEVIAGLALLAGVIGIANMVGLDMLQRRREMSMLKVVGYSSQGVLGEVLAENGLLGVIGATAAMLTVTLAVTVVGHVAFSAPSFAVSPVDVVGTVAATGCMCMLVAWAIARKATKAPPLEALRYE